MLLVCTSLAYIVAYTSTPLSINPSFFPRFSFLCLFREEPSSLSSQFTAHQWWSAWTPLSTKISEQHINSHAEVSIHTHPHTQREALLFSPRCATRHTIYGWIFNCYCFLSFPSGPPCFVFFVSFLILFSFQLCFRGLQKRLRYNLSL